MSADKVFHPVGDAAAFPANDVRGVSIAGAGVDGGNLGIAVGRSGDNFFAVARRCPHAGGDLAQGIVSRGDLVCPHHHWCFSTTTGQHDSLASMCIATYAVRVRDGIVEVGL